MVTGMGTVWKQGHWMLTATNSVVSINLGCIRCYDTVGATLGANLCCGFSQFATVGETLLMHWAYRIEDTNTFDVVGDCYLFTSLAVRI